MADLETQESGLAECQTDKFLDAENWGFKAA